MIPSKSEKIKIKIKKVIYSSLGFSAIFLETSMPWEPSGIGGKCTGWALRVEGWDRGVSRPLVCVPVMVKGEEERSARPQDAGTSCCTACNLSQKIWNFHCQQITETTHDTHFADTKTVPHGPLPWACDILDYSVFCTQFWLSVTSVQ